MLLLNIRLKTTAITKKEMRGFVREEGCLEMGSDRKIPEAVCKYQQPGGDRGSVSVHVCPP